MPRPPVLARLLLWLLAAGCGGPAGDARIASSVGRAPGPAAVALPAAPSPPPAASPPPAPVVTPPPPPPARVAELRAAVRAGLAVARTRQIARLRAYRAAGRFPARRHPFGRPPAHRILEAPLFVDLDGNPCAVAYLMQRAGWAREVAAIAQATPGVHVEEVTSGPIVDWVLRSGLTQDEATLIQPDYRVFAAKLDKEIARDRKRLHAHFRAVEAQLIATTEVSLDIATVRLLPAMLAGGSLAELEDRAPAAPPPPGAGPVR